MNTNLDPPIPSPRSLTAEGLAAAVGIMGSALLVAKRLFAAKPPKPEPMSRGDFYAELVVLKQNEVSIRSLRFLLFGSWNNFGARNLVGVVGHARCSQQRQQQQKGK